MSSTPEFFNVQPVQTALEMVFAHCTPQPRVEMLDPRDALGRVLAAPSMSPIDLPEFRAARWMVMPSAHPTPSARRSRSRPI